jgi:hypothetical protein
VVHVKNLKREKISLRFIISPFTFDLNSFTSQQQHHKQPLDTTTNRNGD